MNKNLRLIAAALATAAIAIGLTWAPARADQSESFHYVAGEGGGDLMDPRHGKAGTIAPSWAHVVPDGEEISLSVDDRGALDRQEVPVVVYDGETDRDLFAGCMPVRTTVTVTGTRPGHEVSVKIGRLQLPGCSANATTGVATITGGRIR